jgi:hypothetical protein
MPKLFFHKMRRFLPIDAIRRKLSAVIHSHPAAYMGSLPEETKWDREDVAAFV